jgi:NAD(P)-dependent dehydrogenase (short-subunit alcohol dehydrogenase family)
MLSAEAVAWLLSDAASFVTGAVVEADGGVAAV